MQPTQHQSPIRSPARRSLPLDSAWLFIPLATFVIVGSSNAVNLTDGLDGLAGGCLLCDHRRDGLGGLRRRPCRVGPLLGCDSRCRRRRTARRRRRDDRRILGFLWFNCHPASVFMGDTGSLPLGGLLGLLAVASRQELLLAVAGGVFVAEAASVIAQVAWFRLLGKRIFLCAPLHHHFQLKGWPEDKIVVRFWIAAAVCAVTALAGLKLCARHERQIAAKFCPAKSTVIAGRQTAFLPSERRE